jgi:hypothetical protein
MAGLATAKLGVGGVHSGSLTTVHIGLGSMSRS